MVIQFKAAERFYMKSIVEEASSLVKAIEKGWIRAGKPQEFTVKVFEEAEKNFFGFTTKSAKVGILFEERMPAQQHRPQKDRQPQRRPQPNQAQPSNQQYKPSMDRQERQPQAQPSSYQQRNENIEPRVVKRDSSPWSPDLVSTAHEWINDSLAIMGRSDVEVKPEVNNFALKLTFIKPVIAVNEKEKLLFKSWAYLIMQTLRQKYKRPLKGLKVILTSE